MSISPRELAAAVTARLEAQLVGVPSFQGEATDVPLAQGGDGRAVQYYVVSASVGTPTDEQDLGDSVDDLDWTVQVTCAGPEQNDALELAARVHAALYRWAPVISGVATGRLKPPAGYQPLVQLDRSVQPHRPFVPLQYVNRNTR